MLAVRIIPSLAMGRVMVLSRSTYRMLLQSDLGPQLRKAIPSCLGVLRASHMQSKTPASASALPPQLQGYPWWPWETAQGSYIWELNALGYSSNLELAPVLPSN